MPLSNIDDFQRKKNVLICCYGGFCREVFAVAFYAKVHARILHGRQGQQQNCSDALFLLPAPVRFQTGSAWSGLVWPGVGEIPICWHISRHRWKESFSGLQHYLPGDWWVEGKFYPAQPPETLWMVSPVAIKERRKKPHLPGTPVRVGEGFWRIEGALPG